ncbi:uncharacterized protein LOC116300595 isoform X3 [Actinia tenebrosa]|nr:uncharacterized protein LOC116300595 isoform X3 [Actinia tenebrosa]
MSYSSNDKMSSDRQRLRPWLEARVDSGDVPGLCWLDKERTKFRVTWKHAGKPDFDLDKDAVLFRMWAEHTGKYKRGEQPDPSTWKTRFRCALHKMPDIEEIRVPHSLDEKEPYRVFRLKPKVPCSPKSKLRTSSSLSVNTPSPSPPNDYDTGFLYPGTFQAHNGYYGTMSYNPTDICAFPSPISSHASSPPHSADLNGSTSGGMYGSAEDDIDNITPTLPPIGLFGSNGHLESSMDTLSMKPQQVPYGISDDYFMKANFTNSFNNNSVHTFCYPMSSGESQCEPTFTELQNVRSDSMIGYGGGGSGTGMYEATPFSGMTNNMGNSGQSSLFTAQNGSNSQLPGLLKMLHAGFPMEMVHEMNQMPQLSNGFSGSNMVDISTTSTYSTTKMNEMQPVSSYSSANGVTLYELEKLAISTKHFKDKTECLMSVRVFYEETEMVAFDLKKDESILRLFYGKQVKQESNTGLGYYSQCNAKQVQLPDLSCSADVKRELADFNRGLVVEMSSDGNIWATRLCLSKVFYACQSKPATKLLQEVKTKVFDFTDEFQRKIREGKTENCVTSPYDVTFILGQQPSNASVSIVITHVQAKRCILGKKICHGQSVSEPIISDR